MIQVGNGKITSGKVQLCTEFIFYCKCFNCMNKPCDFSTKFTQFSCIFIMEVTKKNKSVTRFDFPIYRRESNCSHLGPRYYVLRNLIKSNKNLLKCHKDNFCKRTYTYILGDCQTIEEFSISANSFL